MLVSNKIKDTTYYKYVYLFISYIVVYSGMLIIYGVYT
jgi:hypothetical protein